MSTELPTKFIDTLKLTEKYFWMAFNNISIDDVPDFDSLWVAQNKICFLQDGKIKINFPKLPRLLKADIRRILRESRINISVIPQVQRYIVEELFFDFAKQNNIVVLNNSDSITFTVNQVQQLGVRMYYIV